MSNLLDQFNTLLAVNPYQAAQMAAATLAFIVSLLTLNNAATLRTGVLAVSTFAFGTGMLSLSAGFFLLALPNQINADAVNFLYPLLFIIGFIFLGFGSYKIYLMSKIK